MQVVDDPVQAAIDRYDEILYDDRPCSLVECARKSARMTGSFNLSSVAIHPNVYREYVTKQADLLEAEDQMMDARFEFSGEEEESSIKRNHRTKRKFKAPRPCTIDSEGNLKFLNPRDTPWCMMCVANPTQVRTVPKFRKKFRRRFRMPHEAHWDLPQEVKASPMFGRWLRKDCTGIPASPVELLLLGALRYLGGGLTFDDLEEYTAIGEETHRQFFHMFIECGEKTLYPKHVHMPTTAQEFRRHQHEHNIGGLNGCGFSTDGTHVIMWRCSHGMRQAHLGFKESHPARTYNVSTNHRREMVHSTKGHPSRWNDKTLAHFDELLVGLYKGKILQDVQFELLAWVGEVGRSPMVVERHRGGWCIADNGHHRWSCTQAPAEVNMHLKEQRLSDWIESFRKDAECVFGTLKGRWRILKTGMRLHDIRAADRIWLTCCALHDRLLQVDGLTEPWDGELGENDVEGMRNHAPHALRRPTDDQLRTFGSRQHEKDSNQEVTPLTDPADMETDDPSPTTRFHEDGSVHVNSLSYDDFRERLVTHFDTMRRQYRIKWPKRTSVNDSNKN